MKNMDKSTLMMPKLCEKYMIIGNGPFTVLYRQRIVYEF